MYPEFGELLLLLPIEKLVLELVLSSKIWKILNRYSRCKEPRVGPIESHSSTSIYYPNYPKISHLKPKKEAKR